MILFPLQEAELLDRYSVLMVKDEHGLDVRGDILAFALVVGDKLSDAMESDEFRDLIAINRTIFSLVEKARKDECLASDVASANDSRYLAKAAIQKRWFKTKLGETKTGINRNE